SRCSSSYATRIASCSRSGGVAAGGGVSSTSSPPRNRQDFARATPSTSTPASITRAADAREPTWEATNASRREPDALSGTRTRRRALTGSVEPTPVRRDEREQQDRDADDDEAVGEVERRPELQIEEVRHVPEPDAVDEVRHAAADDEAQRNREDGMARSGAGEEQEHPADREGRQHDHDRRRAREQAERAAHVLALM